jgi:hypothetical protein
MQQTQNDRLVMVGLGLIALLVVVLVTAFVPWANHFFRLDWLLVLLKGLVAYYLTFALFVHLVFLLPVWVGVYPEWVDAKLRQFLQSSVGMCFIPWSWLVYQFGRGDGFKLAPRPEKAPPPADDEAKQF